MLITRESDYALRLLRALRDGERRSAEELARRELVPQQFAYKVLKKLAKAGILSVTRGAEGGYLLTSDLGQVSLYDLMQAMGEDRRISSCMDPGYRCPWRETHGGCSVHCKLAAIQGRLDGELRAHSLSSILNDTD